MCLTLNICCPPAWQQRHYSVYIQWNIIQPQKKNELKYTKLSETHQMLKDSYHLPTLTCGP